MCWQYQQLGFIASQTISQYQQNLAIATNQVHSSYHLHLFCWMHRNDAQKYDNDDRDGEHHVGYNNE